MAPGDLAVVVGVDIDKAGRDQLAAGIDLFAASDAQTLANREYFALADGDIRGEGGTAAAVDHQTFAYHQICLRCHQCAPHSQSKSQQQCSPAVIANPFPARMNCAGYSL